MKLIFAAVAVSALMSAPAFANMDLAKKNAAANPTKNDDCAPLMVLASMTYLERDRINV